MKFEWWQIALVAIGGWIALGGPQGSASLLNGLADLLRRFLGIKPPDGPSPPSPHDHDETLAADFACLAHLAGRLRSRGQTGRDAAAAVVNAATPVLLQEVIPDESA